MWRSYPFVFVIAILGSFGFSSPGLSQKGPDPKFAEIPLKYSLSQRVKEAFLIAQNDFLKTKLLVGIEISDPKAVAEGPSFERTFVQSFTLGFYFVDSLPGDQAALPSGEFEGSKVKQFCDLKVSSDSKEKFECVVEKNGPVEKFKMQFPIAPGSWHPEALILSLENFLHLFEEFPNPSPDADAAAEFLKKLEFISKIRLWHSASQLEKGPEADVQGRLFWTLPEQEKPFHQAFWCHDHEGKKWDCHRLRRPGPFEPKIPEPEQKTEEK